MTHINRDNHPLLYSMSQKARWVGKDDFPASPVWADEVEKWLRFVDNRGKLDRFFLPRLRDRAPKRDETLSEIAVAYFLETQCGLRIKEWEPEGSNGMAGEFLVDLQSNGQMFVEVKSPGWEKEIVDAQGPSSFRLSPPKYLSGDGGSTDPVMPVRQAVAKAYPKLPDAMPTLLIIADDLIVSLNAWGESAPQAALYSQEDGCFAEKQYERLGAVGIFNVFLKASLEYKFAVFRNPNCLDAVALPCNVFPDYPVYDRL